jgi:hypothetical protein
MRKVSTWADAEAEERYRADPKTRAVAAQDLRKQASTNPCAVQHRR